MLVSKSKEPKSGDIVSMRLTNGEEVVGKLVSDHAGDYTLLKPIAIRLQMLAPGQPGLAFAPFMLARDDDGEFKFPAASIQVIPAIVRDDIKSYYLKETTGLEIPTAGQTSSLIRP